MTDSAFPIVIGEMNFEAMGETHAAAEKAKAEAEATRAYVLEHVDELRGKEIPVEIASVQNLPGHSCLIVNDHLLLSYREAEALIRKLRENA